MKISSKKFVPSILIFFNVVLISILFGIFWFIYCSKNMLSPFFFWGNWFIIALFIFLYLIFSITYDSFKISILSISELIYSHMLSIFFTDFIMFTITIISIRTSAFFLPMFIMFLGHILISIIWCNISTKIYFSISKPLKSAIIYDLRDNMNELIHKYNLNNKFEIQNNYHVSKIIDNLDALKNIEVVFISGVHSHERNIILKYCMYNGIITYMVPRISDTIIYGAEKIHMFHLPMLTVERCNPPFTYVFTKRIFDIVFSLIALIILSPIMFITAVIIKLYDKGPILYSQIRLTKNGKHFKIHKFRSMKVDAEKDGIARLSTGDNDDRVTPVGKVIRKIRIDELPQLFNILIGDLSIVGPRPERPEIASKYEKDIPEFKLRLQTKAGLTGYAQVYGKYNTEPYDKLLMDLTYISNPSIIQDIKICIATIKILFMPESTEGYVKSIT